MGGNLAIKFDIRKAFDTLDWNFLLKVLQAFGFHQQFCAWILSILKSAKLSFLVNGHSVGFFSCKRGVRQGDPLSPLLFCLAEEVLSRSISNLVNDGKMSLMSGLRNCKPPSHILYAFDILIFCRGSKQNLRNLMALFKEYGDVSGQVLSSSKCRFYAGSTPNSRIATIKDCLGFSAGSPPFTYLGVPLFKHKPKRIHLPIADRIKNKLASWKGSLLSIKGRVQLVQSIIQGMLIYSFRVYSWPASLLHSLDKWVKNFIWSGDSLTRKLITVSWNKVCKPLAEGGLGIRPFKTINEAGMLHLCWKLLSQSNQWTDLVKARFFKDKMPIQYYAKSSIWPALKGYVQTFHLTPLGLLTMVFK